MGTLIDRIIAASIRHRVAVLGATLALAAAGAWAFVTLRTDAFPDLTPNQVLVMTTVPGLSPVEVEQQVTYPMEVAMLGLPGTTGVRSVSKTGLSVVTWGSRTGSICTSRARWCSSGCRAPRETCPETPRR